MTVSKENNFLERLVRICFAKYCSYGKRAEQLLSVAEKGKERFPVICTRTLFMASLVAFCTFDPLFAASVSGTVKAFSVNI